MFIILFTTFHSYFSLAIHHLTTFTIEFLSAVNKLAAFYDHSHSEINNSLKCKCWWHSARKKLWYFLFFHESWIVDGDGNHFLLFSSLLVHVTFIHALLLTTSLSFYLRSSSSKRQNRHLSHLFHFLQFVYFHPMPCVPITRHWLTSRRLAKTNSKSFFYLWAARLKSKYCE